MKKVIITSTTWNEEETVTFRIKWESGLEKYLESFKAILTLNWFWESLVDSLWINKWKRSKR